MQVKSMKSTLVLLALSTLVMTGCSKTWSGLKQDTSEIFTDTKGIIHEATAPRHSQVQQTKNKIVPVTPTRVSTVRNTNMNPKTNYTVTNAKAM